MIKAKQVLVAEDSDADFFLLQHAFQKAHLPHKLYRVPDGELALAYLFGRPPFFDRKVYPLPHLAILDIKMPKATGFDVLMSLRGRADLQVPAIILSGSDLPEDREMALRLGAIDFFTKPAEANRLVEMAQTIHHLLLV